MSSQIDFFASQPEERTSNEVPEVPTVASTCPPRTLNLFKWIILFDHDENEQFPFNVFQASQFGSEIKDSWVKSTLGDSSRMKCLKLSALENKTVSLFAKIDSGKTVLVLLAPSSLKKTYFYAATTAKDRNIIKERLNEEYLHLLQEFETVQAAFKKLVEKYAFAFMADHVSVNIYLCDVIESMYITKNMHNFFFKIHEDFDEEDSHFAKFPSHTVLLKKLQEAKATATKNKSRVYVTWRGYRGFVNAGKSKITKEGFLKHLMSALDSIKNRSKEEEKVGCCIF